MVVKSNSIIAKIALRLPFWVPVTVYAVRCGCDIKTYCCVKLTRPFWRKL